MVEGFGDDVLGGFLWLLAVSIILGTLLSKFITTYGLNRDAYFRSVADTHTSINETRGMFGTETNNTMVVEAYEEQDVCAICLSPPNIPTQTNCGHLFCGECITIYWQSADLLGAITCPVCRQQVNLLLAGWSRDNSEEHEIMRRRICDYNYRYSGFRSILSYLFDLPTLMRHLWHAFFSFNGLMFWFRLRVVSCFLTALIYFISPLDVIPEAIFGILGLLDDCLVILFVVFYLSIIYRQYLLRLESQMLARQ